MTVLERIRRRSRVVASAILPLLAVAWLDKAAACVGMMPGDAAPEHSRPTVGPHDHPALHGSADSLGGARHAHGRASVDDAAGAHAKAADTGPLHEHGSCPHCPTSPASGGLAPDHVACSVSDGTVAATASTAASPDSKASLPPVAWTAPPEVVPAAVIRRAAVQAAAPPLRPLTLRYCVLLL